MKHSTVTEKPKTELCLTRNGEKPNMGEEANGWNTGKLSVNDNANGHIREPTAVCSTYCVNVS